MLDAYTLTIVEGNTMNGVGAGDGSSISLSDVHGAETSVSFSCLSINAGNTYWLSTEK